MLLLSNYSEMIFWTGGITVCIFLLFILSKYLKRRAQRQMSDLDTFGMDLDQLKHMRRTGLLSDEEIRHIRRNLSRRILENMTEKTHDAPPDDTLKEALDLLQKKKEKDSRSSDGGAPSESKKREKLAAKPKKKSNVSPAPPGKLDIDELLARGAITQDQYERLREIYDRKG